jgi:hypothetical protein
MTTAKFRDYFDVWDEQLEYHTQQTEMWGKDVNLVSFFARWTDDMYRNGLLGLKALYDAEEYERPSADSQFIFPFTHHKRQYDMTFAVRVVRRMFLQVRPDLQASIAGLNERDLLPKMEALLGGGAPMASSPDDLSSLLTQLQALNGSEKMPCSINQHRLSKMPRSINQPRLKTFSGQPASASSDECLRP